jgi:hypothetical protein
MPVLYTCPAKKVPMEPYYDTPVIEAILHPDRRRWRSMMWMMPWTPWSHMTIHHRKKPPCDESRDWMSSPYGGATPKVSLCRGMLVAVVVVLDKNASKAC